MKTFIISTFFAILLNGCATTPVSNEEAVSVPVDAIYQHQTANTGKVTIKRDSGYSASLCSTRIFVNAQPIADIDTSEKVVIYLPAKDYIFSALANGICAGGLTEINGTVQAGKELTYRVGYGSSGEFSINPTAF